MAVFLETERNKTNGSFDVLLKDMCDYLTGTKQTLWNVFNNAIQGRSQDFCLAG